MIILYMIANVNLYKTEQLKLETAFDYTNSNTKRKSTTKRKIQDDTIFKYCSTDFDNMFL